MKKRSDKPLSKGQARRQKKSAASGDKTRYVLAGLLLAFITAAAVLKFDLFSIPGKESVVEQSNNVARMHSERRLRPEYARFSAPAYAKDHSFKQETVLVWGGDHQFAEDLQQNSVSNICLEDYAGADSCKSCHADNHALWSNHSHRWMNAMADERSVKGDFSGGPAALIQYLNGTAEFYRADNDYRMKLTRDGVERVFKVNRTLGSRIHQYYVGVLQSGPEPEGHAFRTTDHVLPFGYELTLKEWIPIVHATGHTGKDSERDDPFEIPSRLPYDTSCSVCHTTPPMGNLMLAMFKRFAAYTPRKLHFEGSNYIDDAHPGAVKLKLGPSERFTAQNLSFHVNDIREQSQNLLRQANAVNLGIACEACHLGAKAHAENEKILPPFYPSGPHVFAAGVDAKQIWGKTDENKNFICARCHSGSRPQYAAGMAVWNSTEYTDARRGHCYDPEQASQHGMQSLTCVACHNPHEAIGRRWQKTPEQDQESCVRCHTEYQDTNKLQLHTHHSTESTGSQCMNCHMPKINEGMGDLVRTHTIFSPTNAKMINANQPNACNMCHVEESIDWTLDYLGQWYGRTANSYSAAAINANYPDRTKSTALGWLRSPHSSTRLVGADVLLKAKAEWALPQLLITLDDPYLENRQFSVQRLRDYFDIDTGKYGYKLYMTAKQRQAPVKRMIAELTQATLE